MGVVEGVEAGEHAEAAAAVADDEADGAAPPEAGLAGRVLGGDVEVLVEVAVDAPAPARARRLHAAPRLSPSRALRAFFVSSRCVCVCSLLTDVTGSGRDTLTENY